MTVTILWIAMAAYGLVMFFVSPWADSELLCNVPPTPTYYILRREASPVDSSGLER